MQEDGSDKGAHQPYLGAERNALVNPNWFQPCQCLLLSVLSVMVYTVMQSYRTVLCGKYTTERRTVMCRTVSKDLLCGCRKCPRLRVQMMVVVVIVALSSHSRIWSKIFDESIPACGFSSSFLRWRSAHALQIHSLSRDQSTEIQRACGRMLRMSSFP